MPLAVVWVLLDTPWNPVDQGVLSALKNNALDWRYRARGEIEAVDPETGKPLKLIYVDVDAQAVSDLGERPWNRRVYADVAAALIQLGRIRSVGYDFVLSSLMTTEMVPLKKINDSNVAMSDVIKAYPAKVVLAASYTGIYDLEYMERPSDFPFLYNPDFNTASLPEMPSAPIIDLIKTEDGFTQHGCVGLINVDDSRNLGVIPRWVPLFANFDGEAYTRNFAVGKIRQFSTGDIELKIVGTKDNWELQTLDGITMFSYPRQLSHTFHAISVEMLRQMHQLPVGCFSYDDDNFYINDEAGEPLYTIPMEDRQLVEVNWHSAWISPHNPRHSMQYVRDWWKVFLRATGIEYQGEGRPDLSALNVLLNRAVQMNDPKVDFIVGAYHNWQFARDPEQWQGFRENTDNSAFFENYPSFLEMDAAEAERTLFDMMVRNTLALTADDASWKAFQQTENYGKIRRRWPQLDEMDASAAALQAYAQFEEFRDALVLVGPVDKILQDLAPSPYDASPVPKVGVHGNLIKTIYSGNYIRRLHWVGDVVIVFALAALAAFAGLYNESGARWVRGVTTVILVGYIVAVFWIFSETSWVLPLIAPVGAMSMTGVVGLAWRLVIEEKQKGRIKGMFGAYLSPALVSRMVESGEEPQLGGIDADITAFFSDVQGFSSFSEQLAPHQLVNLMNEYLTAMTDILMEWDCYVDKYIGDAIVGIFNAPVPVEKHALKACIVTQIMQHRLGELRAKWRMEGDKWPPVVSRMQMRIGLNTGKATVGNMGSERRFNYTMMGDTVNLAARCESGAKTLGVYTMITGETKRAAEAAGDDCVFRFLDKIVVKGRTEPAEMYEIVCLRKDLHEETARCIELYNEGIEHYHAQEWDSAIYHFESAAKLEPNRAERNPVAPETPSQIMLSRARKLKENPPGRDWDGVFVMKTK